MSRNQQAPNATRGNTASPVFLRMPTVMRITGLGRSFQLAHFLGKHPQRAVQADGAVNTSHRTGVHAAALCAATWQAPRWRFSCTRFMVNHRLRPRSSGRRAVFNCSAVAGGGASPYVRSP